MGDEAVAPGSNFLIKLHCSSEQCLEQPSLLTSEGNIFYDNI